MGAKLVERQGASIVSEVELGDEDLIIGRDPQAGYFLDDPRISRRHAVIQVAEDGDYIQDLGSANGTRVNHVRIDGAVLLEFGDVIDLGRGIELHYEKSRGSWLLGGALLAAGVLVLLGAGVYFFRGEPASDPLLDQAVQLAVEGVALYQAGEAGAAKRKVNSALALLSSGSYLEGVPVQRFRAVSLGILEERLETPFELDDIYAPPGPPSEPPPATALRGSARSGPCRLEEIDPRDLDLCVRERAERILMELWQDPREIPEEFYEAVNEQLRMLAGPRRDWVSRALARGEPLKEMMEEELEAAKVPKTLRYLSMIESGYQTEIRSKAGAVGLWEFIPSTAKAYGLVVKGKRDDRKDPRKSTRAAARYLRDLAFEFGGDALLLAIASYNKGENGMRRALKKLEDPRLDRSYWSLVERDLLPSETQDYVPRLVAAAVLGEAGVPPEEAL